MSVSVGWTTNPKNINKVVIQYRTTVKTVQQIADSVGSTPHNVMSVINTHFTKEEKAILKSKRYSLSKMGDKNPSKGKKGPESAKWLGEVKSGLGYLTVLHNGKRQLVHRVKMALLLGIEFLPKSLVVHHIDGDKMNNEDDNLALMTQAAHMRLHKIQADLINTTQKEKQ